MDIDKPARADVAQTRSRDKPRPNITSRYDCIADTHIASYMCVCVLYLGTYRNPRERFNRSHFLHLHGSGSYIDSWLGAARQGRRVYRELGILFRVCVFRCFEKQQMCYKSYSI